VLWLAKVLLWHVFCFCKDEATQCIGLGRLTAGQLLALAISGKSCQTRIWRITSVRVLRREKMKEEPHSVDVHVGKTIRIQRLLRKVSQTELGDRVGVTFQQIQKYEKGSNRVSASMLVEIAGALKVDVRTFFDDLSAPDTANDNPAPSEEFIISREGVLLNAAFFSIKNEALRKKILKLVQAIAHTEQVEGEAAE
jgi:transcriptional regulator with XRE-family HTH domain